MERISEQDAGLLRHEGRDHLHVGAVLRFAGPPPGAPALLEHVRARLERAPRYRQRPAWPAAPLARWAAPRWIDDPRFNLEYHVRHAALPAPGDAERLRLLTARIFSQALDRTKPLWELWVVEGLEDDGWALIAKTHHALVDEEEGVALLAVLLDATPDSVGDAAASAWQPRPEPSPAELTVAAVNDATLGLALPRAALRGARHAGGAVRERLAAAPVSPLRGHASPHRRVAELSVALDDVRAVKAALGGTVNDVVLAAVAGGLRRWLHARGQRTQGEVFTAAVPLAVRAGEGQRIVQAFAPLPVTLADPVARLTAVQEALAGVKERRGAVRADLIAEPESFDAPTILARAARIDAGSAYDVLVTNVPGPPGPRWALGRELESLVPLSFLAGDRGLAVTCASYGGRIAFGLLADYDALGDLDVLAAGIGDALAELVAAAQDPVHARRKPGSSA